MKKKPWYIWLSFLAFMFLAAHSNYHIWKYAWKNKISLLDDQSAWFRFCGHLYTGLVIVRMMLPLSVLMILYTLNETRWEVLSTIIAEWLNLIFVYFLGVYLARKHMQWREKNIAHMLKPKKEEHSQ